MRSFESDVQLIKYEVLKEVIKLTLEGNLRKKYKTISKKIFLDQNQELDATFIKREKL